MFKVKVCQDPGTITTSFIFSVDYAKMVESVANTTLIHKMFDCIVKKLTERYMRENSAKIMAKIKMKEIVNQIKNEIALEAISKIKSTNKEQK